jgi:hypothetical protein
MAGDVPPAAAPLLPSAATPCPIQCMRQLDDARFSALRRSDGSSARWPSVRGVAFQPSPAPGDLTLARVQWYSKLNGYAFWFVGFHRNASVELNDQALDHLEAQARPGLVDIETHRKTDPLI